MAVVEVKKLGCQWQTMKKPIEWHKECLGNARASAQRARQDAQRTLDQAADLEKQCIAYDAQIILAEEMGLTEFDREKFGKSKRPPSTGASGD